MKSEDTLATELIREIKATSRRWFVAFVVVLFLWFLTIAGFIIYQYCTIPTEEVSYQQEVDNVQDSDINQKIGSEYDGERDTESHKKDQRN